MKKAIIALVVIIILAIGGFALYKFLYTSAPVAEVQQPAPTPVVTEPAPAPAPTTSAETNDNLDIAIDELGSIPQ